MNRTKQVMEMIELQKQLDIRVRAGITSNPFDESYMPKLVLAYLAELGEFLNERPDMFKYWKRNYVVNHNKALEEWVDVWHFFLSMFIISKPEGISEESIAKHMPYPRGFMADADMFLWLTDFNLSYASISTLISIGEILGYPFDEVYNMYLFKNGVNHQRQEEGY